MSRRWRNIFFVFGLAAIVLMLLTFDSTWEDIRGVIGRAGLWLPAVILLWVPIYLMNALAWHLIIRDGTSAQVPFLQVFKMSVTGFALNYTTPFGLMGGEPYRIMELSNYVGTEKASSSVVLYVMMHICSHFCFWLSAIALYVVLHFCGVQRYGLDGWMILLLLVLTLVLLFVCYLFSRGFRYGFVVQVFGLLRRMPLAGRWSDRFMQAHSEQLELIDSQICRLHSERRRPFYASLLLEYAARVVGCIEYWLLIGILIPDVTFCDSIIIMAFSSFFSNLMFFLPMQLGSREGGLAIATAGIAIPGAAGLSTALMTRIRELFWIVVGIGIMKIGNRDDKRSAA